MSSSSRADMIDLINELKIDTTQAHLTTEKMLLMADDDLHRIINHLQQRSQSEESEAQLEILNKKISQIKELDFEDPYESEPEQKDEQRPDNQKDEPDAAEPDAAEPDAAEPNNQKDDQTAVDQKDDQTAEEQTDEPPTDFDELPTERKQRKNNINDDQPTPRSILKKTPKKQVRIISRSDMVRSRAASEDLSDYQSDGSVTDTYYDESRYDGTIDIDRAMDEILHVVTSFKNVMEKQIKELRKFKRMKLLTDKARESAVEHHNDLRTATEYNIDAVMDAMRDGDELPKKFDRKIDKMFESVTNKLNKLLI